MTLDLTNIGRRMLNWIDYRFRWVLAINQSITGASLIML